MSSRAVVVPPHVARPLRLLPFRALMLPPARGPRGTVERALARPGARVEELLSRWAAQGRLTHDATPGLYLHEYTTAGITVRGLVGALDVSRRAEDPGEQAVLPHEGVHCDQVEQLAERMEHMEVDPAPILLVHRGSARLRELLATVRESDPLATFADHHDQHHRLWAVRDPAHLDLIAEALATTRVLIADGHHRYAAYLALQDRTRGGDRDTGLAMLVDQDDTPLFLGPIHRVLPGTSLESLTSAARTAGIGFTYVTRREALTALGPTSVVATDGRQWAILAVASTADRAAVEILHQDLLPARLGSPPPAEYRHTVESALTEARPGRTVAVLMPAVDLDLVTRIATTGRLLPEKATSFQPKPTPGLLIRALRDGPVAR
ncbi:DUF1015 family protein [Nocardioides sp. dk4132]|uniref:DUF1015 family protein n=1 Tax=unclassified Nocardioides TaxID=2615069 RepID=UPI0012952A9E|nr:MULTISPECIES: DUF1015 family protein [unclassified Nocardioides]MQW75355.1 DUF1015 family protein [Nocardioides sp. dk4132]QGA07500.1 DUF1015 family protein [Nocardioides sp. dk884]